MNNTQLIQQARFAYEHLGLTTKDVAIRYDLPIKLVEETCRQEHWAPSEASLIATEAESLSDLATGLLVKANVHKQISQFLDYKDLEDTILSKLSNRLTHLDPEDVTAIRQIQGAVSAITTLRQSDPLQLLASEEGGVSSGITVNIQNNVE